MRRHQAKGFEKLPPHESMLFVFTTGVDIELHARAQLGDAFDLFQPDEAEKSPF
jgi:hypothetical protein